MLSLPGLRLALHVGNVVSQAGFSTLGARHTIRKVCFRSGVRYKSSLLVEPNLQIRPLSSFLSKGYSCRRWFQHKSPQQDGSLSPPKPSSKPSPPLKKDSDFVTKGDTPTPAEQRRSDWGITKRLLVNVWPKNDWKTRWIVLLGFGLLVSSKVSDPQRFSCLRLYGLFFPQVLNVQVPQIFKDIVDSLNVDITASSTVWLLAGSLILGCTSFATPQSSNSHHLDYH